MQQEPAEVAERRTADPPMAGSGDPFDVDDPFGLSGSGEEDGTDSGGQEDQELPPPDAKGNGTDASEGPSRTPAEEFKIQKAKTVKTTEPDAGVRRPAADEEVRVAQRADRHGQRPDRIRTELAQVRNSSWRRRLLRRRPPRGNWATGSTKSPKPFRRRRTITTRPTRRSRRPRGS